MMKRLFFYFLILFAAIWLGIKINKDPGYVLISYQQWSLETTLWFAILALLVFFLVFYLLIRIWRGSGVISNRFQSWLEQRRNRKAIKLTNQGLCQLAEGDWDVAEKNLIKGADHSDTPLINYLAAASAAQHQGHFEGRDSYLRQAHASAPQAEVAIGLTQAQLQFNAKQWELALATLRHLNHVAPHHKYILELLKRVYLELQDWQSLQALLPELRKHKVLKSSDLDKLEHQVYLSLLNFAVITKNPEIVNKMWYSIPDEWNKDPAILGIYSDFLLKNNQDEKAEVLLRDALKRNWHPLLLRRYGLAKAENPSKQLATAESWLKNHGNDAELLLCLGRIAMRNQLWGKARSYLQTSIHIAPLAETYRELGQLLEQLNETNEALDAYRKGLSIAT